MRPLSIGVCCYATLGGSGIVATELGLRLAARGHRVHFVSGERPRRLPDQVDRVWFHRVDGHDASGAPHVPYTLALASTLVAVAADHGLDVVHAHYAVPHATSAVLAREIAGRAFAVVTTLHGTDVTRIGADPLHRPVVAHGVAASDRVTVPSAFLRDEAYRRLGLDPGRTPIDVVPNFVDLDRFHPGSGDRAAAIAVFGPIAAELPVIVHVSNFRPVKRVPAVVEVFARVAAETPALLLLIGDGPDRAAVEAEVARRGLGARVRSVGELDHADVLVRASSVFVLPSASESFGLAALEALASGVPVVASAVGGLPGVVRDGETGFVVPPDDLAGMAARVTAVLRDPALRTRLGAAARADAVARFGADPVVARYEALYAAAIGG